MPEIKRVLKLKVYDVFLIIVTNWYLQGDTALALRPNNEANSIADTTMLLAIASQITNKQFASL